MHFEDYSRQTSLRLLEAKNEARAQHASSITSLKEITSAIKSLDQAIRLGTEQSQMNPGGTPAMGGTPAAPGVGATIGAPPPKAAPAAPGHTGRTGHTGHTGRNGHNSRRWGWNSSCARICILGCCCRYVPAKCTSFQCSATYGLSASSEQSREAPCLKSRRRISCPCSVPTRTPPNCSDAGVGK